MELCIYPNSGMSCHLKGNAVEVAKIDLKALK